MSEIKINRGQIWADKDPREVKAGKRQRLLVEATGTFYVTLVNQDTGRDSGVRPDILRRRFRLVEEPTEKVLAHLDRGERLEHALEAEGIISYEDYSGYTIDFERLADFIAKCVVAATS